MIWGHVLELYLKILLFLMGLWDTIWIPCLNILTKKYGRYYLGPFPLLIALTSEYLLDLPLGEQRL